MSTMTKVMIGAVVLAVGVVVYLLVVGPGQTYDKVVTAPSPGQGVARATIVLYDGVKQGRDRCVTDLPEFIRITKDHANVKWDLVNLCSQTVEELRISSFQPFADSTICAGSSGNNPFTAQEGRGKPDRPKGPGNITLTPNATIAGGCWSYKLYAKDTATSTEYEVADPIIRIDPR
jgi:hypothetical protein